MGQLVFLLDGMGRSTPPRSNARQGGSARNYLNLDSFLEAEYPGPTTTLDIGWGTFLSPDSDLSSPDERMMATEVEVVYYPIAGIAHLFTHS